MKAFVYSINGEKKEQIDLPIQFSEPIREDLIHRAVLALQSKKYQPKGADPLAGTRQGHAISKRRHTFGTTYGIGISRVRRKVMWRRGARFGWQAAFIANAVKGRKAFPPKAVKIIIEKINNKERKKAIRSAIAGTKSLIIDDKLETVKKTKELQKILEKLECGKMLEKSKEKKIRAGKGENRGRTHKHAKGPLIIFKQKCDAMKACQNIPGIDSVAIKYLNAELLAPGARIGRVALWTKGAIEMLDKERLFL